MPRADPDTTRGDPDVGIELAGVGINLAGVGIACFRVGIVCSRVGAATRRTKRTVGGRDETFAGVRRQSVPMLLRPIHRAVFLTLTMTVLAAFWLTQPEARESHVFGGALAAADEGAASAWTTLPFFVAWGASIVSGSKWIEGLAWCAVVAWILSGPLYFLAYYIT